MARGAVAALVGAGLVGFSSPAGARPGTHPVVVTTWDARASSVLFVYRHGFMKGGGFNDVGYNANFSSTSGRLSAQFGLHYQSFTPSRDDPTAHGLSGTATAVIALPITARLDNGLPTVALGFYFGAAPTALISGPLNYVSIPAVLGVGLPVTPAKAVTFTPWFELSPGVNLDTEIHPFEFSQGDAVNLIDPVTGKVELTQDDVQRVVSDSVELKSSVSAGARAGLDLALHLTDHVDFNANIAVGSAGTAFSGPAVVYVGGGFIWRWDDIVPAVLPADRRLLRENCDDIEERFRSCPNSRRWTPPPAAPPPGPTPSIPPAAVTPPPAPAPSAPPVPAAPPPASSSPAPAPAPVPAPAPSPSAPPAPPVGTTSFPP
jgi:hypothetical protein